MAASALVAQGQLNPIGVIAAGATGAAIGDQFYFYLLRRRLPRWMGRFPRLARRAEPLVGRVRKHQTAIFPPSRRHWKPLSQSPGILAVRYEN